MHVENIDLSVPMIEYLILEKCKKDTKLLDEETLPELTDPVAPKYQMNHISETISFSPPLLLRCEKKAPTIDLTQPSPPRLIMVQIKRKIYR